MSFERLRLKVAGRVTAFALVAAVMVVGTASAAAPAAPKTFTIVVANGLSLSWTPLLIASNNGSFTQIQKKYHTRINLISSIGGSAIIPTLAGGQFATVGSILSTNLVLAGTGTPAVGYVHPFAGNGIMVVGAKKYQASRGTNFASWDGATCGTTGPKSATESWLFQIEKKYSITFKEVTFPSVAGFPAALQAGQIDCFVGEIGSASAAINNGVGYMLLNTNTAAAIKAFGPAVPTADFSALPSQLKQYPQVYQAFTDAIIKAMIQVHKNYGNAEGIRRLLPATLEFASDPALFGLQWKLIRAGFQLSNGCVSQAAFKATAAQGFAGGLMKSGQTLPGSIVDNSWVIRAYKDLGMKVPTNCPAKIQSVTVG